MCGISESGNNKAFATISSSNFYKKINLIWHLFILIFPWLQIIYFTTPPPHTHMMLQHIKLYSVPLTSHVFSFFQAFRHVISCVYGFFMTISIWLIAIHSSDLKLDVISTGKLSLPRLSYPSSQRFQLKAFSICSHSL